MAGGLVRRGSVRVSIDFHENKSRRIIHLLDHIKTSDPRFLNTGLRIQERRLPKRINALRLHLNVDMNHDHGRSLMPVAGEIEARTFQRILNLQPDDSTESRWECLSRLQPLLHKKRQRSRVPVEVVFTRNRPDFTIAEESR